MRRRGLGTVLVGFGTTLALVLFNATVVGGRFWQQILGALEHQTHEVPHAWAIAFAWRSLHNLAFAVQNGLAAALAATSLATMAIVVARWVAGSSVRAGKADPLQWLRERPRLVRGLPVLPAVLFALPWADDVVRALEQIHSENGIGWWLNLTISSLLTTGIVGSLAYAASRAGMRGLLAPVQIEEAASPRDPGDIVFSAVAVTTRTRAAVAALAAASVAMVAWTLVNPSHAAFPWALAAYIAAAMSAPFALRRVSRIAVGIDGVWVRDASRALFFAYRDLEGARARGADLELVARGGGRAVLRLQMHGDDASRRDEVLALVQGAIDRSRTSDTRGAETLVQTMPTGQVVASAAGDARYRLPSISRQQLWDLVESPATDASTRTAAAEALAIHIDESDRARLRVAAEQCAEPRVRVALAALADEDAAAAAAAEEEAAAAQR